MGKGLIMGERERERERDDLGKHEGELRGN